MKIMLTRSLGSLIAVCALSTVARADDWTGPKQVAKSAQEFAGAAEKLQKAIKDVEEDSPLVAEAGALSKSATKLHDSVDKGGTYADAKKDFGKVKSAYTRFEAGLKKAHDIHHEKPVADAEKKAKTMLERLDAHMAGRNPEEKTDQASPRTTREDN